MHTRSEAAWVSTVTVSSQDSVPGSFAEKVEFSKAARVYAAETGTSLGAVTMSMLQKTNLGLKGYAGKFDTTPEAKPRPGGDGTCAKPPARKPNSPTPEPQGQASQVAKPPTENPGKRDFDSFYQDNSGKNSAKDPKDPDEKIVKKNRKGENSVGRKEKEVKELLAQEQASDNAMTVVAAGMTRDPQWWAWARESVNSYKAHRTQVVALYADQPFFTAAKVAALSPKETMKLRKDYKDDYLAKLCEFCTVLGPKILLMAEASFQIQQMADAKKAAAETLQRQRSGVAGKAKAKRKPKAKGQASAQSAQVAQASSAAPAS